MITKNCIICNNSFSKPKDYSNLMWIKRKFCSRSCYFKSREGLSKLTRECVFCGNNFEIFPYRKMSAKYCSYSCNAKNREYSELTKEKMSESHRQEKSWNWIKDRTQLKKKNNRNDMAYKEWRKNVWLRDSFKCKISNQDCSGRIEAHHILSWLSYPELRYEINNGITLCHAHHPYKRVEEKRLAPVFMELVSVSSV